MTDDGLFARLNRSRREIDELIQRGLQIKEMSAVDAVEVNQAWQRDCAAAINQLSGGGKAHWLSRAYSDAFLVRSGAGGIVLEAKHTEIMGRILSVLRQADQSLARMDGVAPASGGAPVARRFEFVRNVTLRPVLEQALADGARDFENGDFRSALMTSCVILEAIITDALERHANNGHPVQTAEPAECSFSARIAAAEEAGLIRNGCARLPPAALAYRDQTGPGGPTSDVMASAREAKVARQVLQVVMRDLDPGR